MLGFDAGHRRGRQRERASGATCTLRFRVLAVDTALGLPVMSSPILSRALFKVARHRLVSRAASISDKWKSLSRATRLTLVQRPSLIIRGLRVTREGDAGARRVYVRAVQLPCCSALVATNASNGNASGRIEILLERANRQQEQTLLFTTRHVHITDFTTHNSMAQGQQK